MRDYDPQILSNVKSKCAATNQWKAYETFLKKINQIIPSYFNNENRGFALTMRKTNKSSTRAE